MRVQYMDVLILILALLGVVTVFFIEFDASHTTAVGNSVTCWAPNHFTVNWIDYTNKFCTHAWKAGQTYYLPFDEVIPRKEDPREFVNPEETGSGNGSDVTLKSLLLAQMIVAVLIFVFLQMVVTVLFAKTDRINEQENTPASVEDDPKQAASTMENQDFINRKRRNAKRISGSSRVTIIYCVILLAAAIAWFILGTKSHGISVDRNGNVASCKDCADDDVQGNRTDAFMCEFKIRRLGNIQLYTVQCIVDPLAKGEGDTRLIAAQANTAVCFTIASLLIAHLLYTLVVVPLVNGFGRKNGFISDVNLAITVGAL